MTDYSNNLYSTEGCLGSTGIVDFGLTGEASFIVQPGIYYESSQDKIAKECDFIKEMLLAKNRKYGDAALSPIRIFSKADSVEQLKVRIDDKLSRVKNATNDEDEDPILDLIGYFILLRIKNKEKNDKSEGNYS